MEEQSGSEKKMQISVMDVGKSFGEARVLNQITFQCSQSEILGVVGRNGSGKSVLFKCISGLLMVDEGEISVGGCKVSKDMDVPPDIGVLIETPPFLAEFSAFDNLKILANINRKIDNRRIKEVLEQFGLDWKSRKKVGKYSMGMRQRLGLAQAVMEDPGILILDEPMNGLDAFWLEETRKLLLQMKKEGKAILLASHNKEDIELLCDRIIRLENGEMVSQ